MFTNFPSMWLICFEFDVTCVFKCYFFCLFVCLIIHFFGFTFIVQRIELVVVKVMLLFDLCCA